MKKIPCEYGIAISTNTLAWNNELRILDLPLDYFLMI